MTTEPIDTDAKINPPEESLSHVVICSCGCGKTEAGSVADWLLFYYHGARYYHPDCIFPMYEKATDLIGSLVQDHRELRKVADFEVAYLGAIINEYL